MVYRCCFIYVFVLLTASLHEGTEGDSVILKCSHRLSIKEQDPAYKNRAEVLPEELKRGRVFLKLTDLQLSDGGTYLCFVPALGIDHSTQLVVKDQIRGHGTGTRLGRTLHLLIPLSGFILHFM
uniref:Zgc:194627 n=1 Tax=Sinocyclocheilus anshuiensis TaxID=1608454 RepID=A0A671SG63_9TELE